MIGRTHGNWLTVEYLWVSEEERHSGIGSGLLAAAEAEARKRGCTFAFLDTFGFQAPTFYPRYGYREVFVLKEYPKTGSRHYFVKQL